MLMSEGFESGSASWMGFGPATVGVTTDDAYNGTASLLVSGRSENWNGAFCNMGSVLSAGKTYHFTAWVNGKSGDTVQFMLKYTDSTEEQYKEIGSADGGEWIEISASYDIPADAKDILIYFQTASGTNDFLIDDVEVSGQAAWSEEALELTPLKDVYANYFRIGCAATPDEFNPPIAPQIVKHHFNSLTIGNELKPDYVLNKPRTQSTGEITVSLDAASKLLSYCEKYDIPVRGHVLCWYSQTPSWFFRENFADDGAYVSKEVMNERLEEYIKEVFQALRMQYPALNVYAWDVVNECYLDNGSLRTPGSNVADGESEWMLIYGDNSFIEQAFYSARRYADPHTKLFYNDFNEYIPEKRDAIYEMVKSLDEKGLIDGIGMQSHLDVGYPDAKLYREAIDKYSELGLEIQITELDITDYDAGPDSDSVAKAYKEIMKVILNARLDGANITAVVFWGLTDGTSWRREGYPLLFNADYSPKKAFYSVYDQISQDEWGEWEETLNPPPTSGTDPYETTEPTQPTDGRVILWGGDVYADRKVDVSDIIYMTKYLHGIESAPVKYALIPRDVASGTPWDLNEDGACDVFDLGLLKRMLLKK